MAACCVLISLFQAQTQGCAVPSNKRIQAPSMLTRRNKRIGVLKRTKRQAKTPGSCAVIQSRQNSVFSGAFSVPFLSHFCGRWGLSGSCLPLCVDFLHLFTHSSLFAHISSPKRALKRALTSSKLPTNPRANSRTCISRAGLLPPFRSFPIPSPRLPYSRHHSSRGLLLSAPLNLASQSRLLSDARPLPRPLHFHYLHLPLIPPISSSKVLSRHPHFSSIFLIFSSIFVNSRSPFGQISRRSDSLSPSRAFLFESSSSRRLPRLFSCFSSKIDWRRLSSILLPLDIFYSHLILILFHLSHLSTAPVHLVSHSPRLSHSPPLLVSPLLFHSTSLSHSLPHIPRLATLFTGSAFILAFLSLDILCFFFNRPFCRLYYQLLFFVTPFLSLSTQLTTSRLPSYQSSTSPHPRIPLYESLCSNTHLLSSTMGSE